MLAAIQSDSTGSGRGPAEGRNTTSPSGKGRKGGGGERRVWGWRGFGGGKGVARGTSGVYLVWVNIDKMQINPIMFCQCVVRCATSKETGHK